MPLQPTALTVARDVAMRAAELQGLDPADYVLDPKGHTGLAPALLTRSKAQLHAPGALAAVVHEGPVGHYDNLLQLTLHEPFGEDTPFYVEAYSSWLIVVWKR